MLNTDKAYRLDGQCTHAFWNLLEMNAGVSALESSFVRRISKLGFSCWLLMISGCPEKTGDPNMVPVKATVTYKSEPVEGATIVFFNPQHFAKGMTDASGVAEMYTNAKGDGVYVGDYQVSVEKQELVIPEGATSREQVTTVWHVPAKYADFSKSRLTATVSLEGENNVTLELKD